jgi:hypothetical protein
MQNADDPSKSGQGRAPGRHLSDDAGSAACVEAARKRDTLLIHQSKTFLQEKNKRGKSSVSTAIRFEQSYFKPSVDDFGIEV